AWRRRWWRWQTPLDPEGAVAARPNALVHCRTPRLPPWLGRDLRLLFTGRALRSLSLGYLNVIAPIYLVALGYSALRIGVVFTAGSLGSMVLTALVGLVADRVGRKPLLVFLGLLTATSGLLFALSPSFGVLLVAAAAGTVGRGGGAGAGGAFGPYFPAEQALIAELSGDRNRTSAFGIVSLIGVLAGAAGSLVATFPSVAPRAPGAPRLGTSTRRMLPRFLITNATNGLAVGMLGPVVVYWFHVRYGASAAQLGGLYFLANLAAAPSNLLAARFARWLGAVRAVVIARSTSVVLLAAVALMPNFWLAGILFLLRTQVNSLSGPIRQSFLMGVVDEADRSTAAGLSNLPLQALSSAGPTIAGQLMQTVWLELPLMLAAALQGVNAGLYYLFFRSVKPPEEG